MIKDRTRKPKTEEKSMTLGTKVPKLLAEAFAKVAKARKMTVSRLLKESIEETVESDTRFVVDDHFEYNSKEDEIIWYGVLESGERWKIAPLDVETAENWVKRLKKCIKTREETRELRGKLRMKTKRRLATKKIK